MSLSKILAELAVTIPATSLPSSAMDAAAKMTLDTLATGIAGWNADGVPESLALLRDWGGNPQCTVLVHGDRLPPPLAAFINGMMIHALDYDDLYRPAALHLMSSVLPVCLAAGELKSRTGRDLLAGVVLGVEVAARLGLALQPCWRRDQGAGFLPSTIIGGFGATAAAARMLGLTVEQTTHALGIYYAQNAGNRQALYDKTLTKRMQPALAARAALWAAQLAERGLTGPRGAIEGDAGLIRLYAASDQKISPAALREALPEYQIEKLAIKRFPSCGACHPLTQAALDLVREHSLEPARIEEIELYLGEGGNRMVGMPFEIGETPQANAQFSVAYGVALALLRKGADITRYTSESILADEKVAALARQIRILHHLPEPPERERFSDDEPSFVDQPHVLTVRTRDGRTLSARSSIRAVLSPESGDFETAAAKLRECAAFSGICPPDQAGAVIEAVRQLKDTTNLDGLLKLCTRPTIH